MSNNQIEQIKQFLHNEICERRDYSASKMCEEVLKFIEALSTNKQTPTPDPKLIDSMAMRYRHDFGLLTDSEKESIRITMKQIWEETAGLGFYKP